MTQIIGIVQIKGGAGRSTVSTNLAAALARNANTVLIDCDMPQATSASWATLRKQAGRMDSLQLATASSYPQLIEQVRQLHTDCDYLILDGPPRMAEMTRAIMIISNLCLIPLGTSMSEIWALSDLLDTLEQARQRQPTLDVRILWNRYRRNTRAARELPATVSEELGLAQMQSRLHFRVAYSEALSYGLAVDEWPDRKAGAELGDLLHELHGILAAHKTDNNNNRKEITIANNKERHCG